MDKKHSTSAFLYPILIPLRHSKRLFQWLVLAHAICFCVLVIFDLSIAKWPWFSVLFISGVVLWRRYARNYFPLDAKSLLLTAENKWYVITADNQALAAEQRIGSFVHPFMVILLLRCQRQSMSIVLMRDNIQHDLFRRLRVRLYFPLSS